MPKGDSNEIDPLLYELVIQVWSYDIEEYNDEEGQSANHGKGGQYAGIASRLQSSQNMGAQSGLNTRWQSKESASTSSVVRPSGSQEQVPSNQGTRSAAALRVSALARRLASAVVRARAASLAMASRSSRALLEEAQARRRG